MMAFILLSLMCAASPGPSRKYWVWGGYWGIAGRRSIPRSQLPQYPRCSWVSP